ncbi:MAG: hypothetical protein HZB85_02610 [Deltaproteobacteria bacterium]|nr:hypothetical protein [Deltaproteobacteria bacterium]
MKIKTSLFKYVAPDAPQELKIKVISGAEPAGGLEPEDRVTALFVLSHDHNAAVAGPAKSAFTDLSNDILTEALGGSLDPLVIKTVVSARKDSEALLTLAALNPAVDDATLCWIAENCPEDTLQVMAEDREQFVARAGFMDAVRKNPSAAALLIERLEGKAAAAQPAGANDGAPAAPAKLDEDEKKILRKASSNRAMEESKNIFQIVSKLSVSQKVKLALSGNKSARELLVKESNKLVCSGVLKNPRITEDEILKLAVTKGTSEDILRHIAKGREWLKNYSIRSALVTNPKTPTTISTRVMESLNDADVLKLSRSKNIPVALSTAAKRRIDAKAKKK